MRDSRRSARASAQGCRVFKLLSFQDPTDPNIVYVEYHTGALYLEKRPEVTRYSLMFDHLRAAALSVEASRDNMARAAEELA